MPVAHVVETNQLSPHCTDESIVLQCFSHYICRLLAFQEDFYSHSVFNASFSMFKLHFHQVNGNEFHIFTMDLTKGLLCTHTWDCKPVTS